MGRSGPAVVRQQLLLCAGIVAITLSVLAMHQLSINHTAANPTPSDRPAVAAAAHFEGQQSGPAEAGSAHLVGAADRHPVSDDGGCPGCAEHHALVLTCLAALIIVAAGWALSGPIAWRGIRLRPQLLRELPMPPHWRPLPMSLTELSISRT